MVLIQKMTHPPISCEKSFESSCWRVGTFSYILLDYAKRCNSISTMLMPSGRESEK